MAALASRSIRGLGLSYGSNGPLGKLTGQVSVRQNYPLDYQPTITGSHILYTHNGILLDRGRMKGGLIQEINARGTGGQQKIGA